jgi:uncharacterized protein involved in outer membrane biogenesis
MSIRNNVEKKKSSNGFKIVKVAGILIVFVFVVLLVTPLFFKGTIVRMVKEEINKNFDASIDFESASLSFIRHFPSLTLNLRQLKVDGKAPFEGERLAHISDLSLRLQVISVLRSGPVEISSIMLYDPDIKLIVNEEGLVNWDIFLSDGEVGDNPSGESGEEPLVMNLRNMQIRSGKFQYIDNESKMEVLLDDLNGSVSGKFSADKAVLSTDVRIGASNFTYDNIKYLSNVKTTYQALIDADFVNSIYVFEKNSLYLNDLALTMDGSVGLLDDKIMLLLTFKTLKSDLKSLLSLIPEVYERDFEKLNTTGSFSFTGAIKGDYSEKSIPGFNIDLKVNDGTFSYTDMPTKMDNIQIALLVSNTSGQPDATLIKLDRFDFNMENNPFKSRLLLKTPVSDPDFDASLNGKLDLEKLSQIVPLSKGESLTGLLQFDVSMKARMSAIENRQFDQVTAMGSVLATQFVFIPSGSGQAVKINRAQMNLAPAYIDLVDMKLQLGESDMQLSGRLENYLTYYLGKGILKGSLNMVSNYLDANALLDVFNGNGQEVETEIVAATDTSAQATELPERIDFTLNATIDSLHYDQYVLKNASAKIQYKNKRLVFDPLLANMMDGKMTMKGYFDGADMANPFIDIDFSIQHFDIPIAYNQIGLMQSIAPVAENIQGDFSTGFKMKTMLDANLKPVFETMRGNGTLQTSKLIVEGSSVFEQLSDMLGNDTYKRLVTDGLNFSYEFVNGRLFQNPFTIKQSNLDLTLGGSVGFDQSIDYDMVFAVPFGILGEQLISEISNATQQLGIPGLDIEPQTKINIMAKLTGEVRSPKITLDYKDVGKNLSNALEQKAREALDREKEEAIQKAREEADKILQKATEQVDALKRQADASAAAIRDQARIAADKLRNEAQKRAQTMELEGKKKGMVAEIAARETARKVRSEADNTATKIIQEADKQADEVLSNSKSQSDEIMRIARERAEKL